MITIEKGQEVTASDLFKKSEKTESLSIITKALEEAHEIIRKETGAPRACRWTVCKSSRAFHPFHPLAI
jgi:hypothetical protein